MPRAVVRWNSSTTTWPFAFTFTPAFSASSRSPLGTRPVATSSVSPRTFEPSLQRDLDAVADLPGVGQLVVVADLPLPGRDVGETHRDVVVVAAQQGAAPDHQRHVAAECGEDVGELARDEPAADDDQALGHVVDAHDGVAGVIGHPAFGDGVGHHGP